MDVHGAHLRGIIERAAAHRGSAFVEILQNCNIFNDGAFADVTDRNSSADHKVEIEHGKPLIFGADRNKGIRLDKNFNPTVTAVGENGVPEEELLHHDEKTPNPSLAYLLSQLGAPDFPTPVGVFRDVQAETYEGAVHRQIREAGQAGKVKDLDALLREGDIWEVD